MTGTHDASWLGGAGCARFGGNIDGSRGLQIAERFSMCRHQRAWRLVRFGRRPLVESQIDAYLPLVTLVLLFLLVLLTVIIPSSPLLHLSPVARAAPVLLLTFSTSKTSHDYFNYFYYKPTITTAVTAA